MAKSNSQECYTVGTAAKETKTAQKEHSVLLKTVNRGVQCWNLGEGTEKNYWYLCPRESKKAEPVDNTAKSTRSM